MAQSPPPLSRRQLEDILGLDRGAENSAIMRASARLLSRLEQRREHVPRTEHAALDVEIAELSSSVLSVLASGPHTLEGGPAARIAALSSSIARERLYMGVILILGTLLIAFFAAWLNQDAATGSREVNRAAITPARLIVSSRPANANLRVRREGSEELLLKIPGDGAQVDLEAGAYEIEISREDCPDVWSRDILLESGETRRYEPTICAGTGELVVRSNVSGDRLRIDELDVGATRAEPHLLGVGDHQIRVDKKGFAPFEGRVRIRPDESIELRAELFELAAGASGGPADGRAEVALPFERVAPTAQPGNGPTTSNPGIPSVRQALLPDPIAPTPIQPERWVPPEALRDFDPSGLGPKRLQGGSTTWHDSVSSRFVARFDADSSGRIDRDSETESIPCEFWSEIERSFDEGRLGLSMTRLYGFDGSEWHPKALGFAREQRALAYERMKACGLAP